MSNIFKIIQSIVDENDVVLFMKGSKDFPQCGFSATTSHILSQLGVNYKDINVLEDMDIRQGIKEFSDWPTIPQLYIKGEFIGGCDIIKEMHEAGEIQEIIKEKGLKTL
jgi:monothiol glutaredoxin